MKLIFLEEFVDEIFVGFNSVGYVGKLLLRSEECFFELVS